MTRTQMTATVADVPTRGRLQPAVNQDTQFFWDAAASGRLAIQRCRECGKLRHPPGPACPRCHSLAWAPTDVSGRGKLHSFTVVHHPPVPGFLGPAIIVLVDLDEGVRLVSNIGGVDPATLVIGESLEVHFVPQDEGWTAPQFRRPCN